MVSVTTAGRELLLLPSRELALGAAARPVPTGLLPCRVAVVCLVDVCSVVMRPGGAGPWGEFPAPIGLLAMPEVALLAGAGDCWIWTGELPEFGAVFPRPDEEPGELPVEIIGLLSLPGDGEELP